MYENVISSHHIWDYNLKPKEKQLTLLITGNKLMDTRGEVDGGMCEIGDGD